MLRTALERAVGGVGSLCFLWGEPGIGKSTLLEEFLREVPASMLLHRGRCWDGDAPPLWVWRSVCAEANADALLKTNVEHDPQERLLLFDLVTRWLQTQARSQTVVLAFEDVHWADDASLLLLQYLSVELSRAAIFVVATCRDAESVPNSPFAKRSAVLVRAAKRILLEGLSSEELAPWCAQQSSLSPRALRDATGGNPFFAQQVLDSLRARTFADSALPLPDTVKTVLEERLALLSPRARSLLSQAAVLDAVLDPTRLAGFSALDAREVIECLEEAERRGVLQRQAGARVLFEFRHALLRETCYDALSLDARSSLHLHAGEWLERTGSGTREQIAKHFLRALPLVELSRVRQQAMQAAQEAVQCLALEQASYWYGQALALMDGAPLQERLECLLSFAETQLHSGALEEGRSAIKQALELSAREEYAGYFARAALALGLYQPMGKVDPQFIAVLETSLSLLPAQDALRARLLARLAAAMQPSADPTVPHRIARQAIALARENASPTELAQVIDAARNAFRVVDDLKERIALDDELIALGASLQLHRVQLNARRRRCVDALELGDTAAALEQLRVVEQLGTTLGGPWNRWHGVQLRCGMAIFQGQFAQAEQMIRAAFVETEAARTLFRELFMVNPVHLLPLALARAQGKRSALQSMLAVNVFPPPMNSLFNAALYAQLGRMEEARVEFARVLAEGLSARATFFHRIVLADVCVRLRLSEHAEALLGVLEPVKERGICWFPMGICEGSFERLRAGLFALQGAFATAVQCYEAALLFEDQLGALPFAARTRLALAWCLLQPGTHRDVSRAKVLHAQAVATFQSLDMELALEEAAQLQFSSVDSPSVVVPLLVREGEGWRATYGDETAHVAELDGVRYLAWLLEHPNTAISAEDLLALSRRGAGTAPVQSSVETETLDDKALASYRKRISELQETIEEAEDFGDLGRKERAQEELEQLTEELARATGLGGRSRTMGGNRARARVNATQRIRKAIARIALQCPAFGAHLEASVQTGTECSYRPK